MYQVGVETAAVSAVGLDAVDRALVVVGTLSIGAGAVRAGRAVEIAHVAGLR